MIGFYVLELIAFSIISDLSVTLNKIIFLIFVAAIIRGISRYVNRLKQEKQRKGLINKTIKDNPKSWM